MEISAASSLNIRMIKRGMSRVLDDTIPFKCSVCGKRRSLGKNESVMVKMSYQIDEGVTEEAKLCGCCTDLLTDMMRYGPRVVNEAHKWCRVSRVARVSLVRNDLFCFGCLGNSTTHLFVKFDDLKVVGESAKYSTKRICAKCALSYMMMLKQSDEVGKRRFPVVKAAMFS
jgi:hypothetical protein